MCEELGVDVVPTLQFRRGGRLLWEHRGVVALDQDLGEGEAWGRWCWGDGRAAGLWSRNLAAWGEADVSLLPPSLSPQACCTTGTLRAATSRRRRL